jgi:hypothetical protein
VVNRFTNFQTIGVTVTVSEGKINLEGNVSPGKVKSPPLLTGADVV